MAGGGEGFVQSIVRRADMYVEKEARSQGPVAHGIQKGKPGGDGGRFTYLNGWGRELVAALIMGNLPTTLLVFIFFLPKTRLDILDFLRGILEGNQIAMIPPYVISRSRSTSLVPRATDSFHSAIAE